MGHLENSIDNVVMVLERTIENKKIQMQKARDQSEPSPMMPHLYSEIFNRVGGYYEQMTNTLGYGKEFAQAFLNKALQSLREEPWEFVRKTAMCSFAVGLFLSLRYKKSSTEGNHG